MKETQQSISQWGIETFGSEGSNLDVAKRAKEELDELIEALEIHDQNPDAHYEIADVMILLTRLATRLGVDVQRVIDEKMDINRHRDWVERLKKPQP